MFCRNFPHPSLIASAQFQLSLNLLCSLQADIRLNRHQILVPLIVQSNGIPEESVSLSPLCRLGGLAGLGEVVFLLEEVTLDLAL